MALSRSREGAARVTRRVIARAHALAQHAATVTLSSVVNPALLAQDTYAPSHTRRPHEVLVFCTGSARVPPGGFAALRPPFEARVAIARRIGRIASLHVHARLQLQFAMARRIRIASLRTRLRLQLEEERSRVAAGPICTCVWPPVQAAARRLCLRG